MEVPDLRKLAEQPLELVDAVDEIPDLHPVNDTEELADLRRKLRAEVRALTGEGSNKAALSVARDLLIRVVGMESPVGARVHKLLRDRPEMFTVPLVAALAKTIRISIPRDELCRDLTEETARFIMEELVPAGVVSHTTWGETGEEPLYRIGPAGRVALEVIAEHALSVETGRFSWPESVAT